MKKEAEKRRSNLRIIATNIFMGISVLVIVAVLVGVAMGYTINKNGELERSGLLRVKSVPSDALVEIDGEAQFSRTEMSKLLSAGEKSIVVTKAGYDEWRGKVEIEEGLMTRLDWVRLFPVQEIVERVHDYKTLDLLSVASGRKHMMLFTADTLQAQIIDLNYDDIKYSDLDFGKILELEEGEPLNGSLEVVQWNKNGDKILMTWDKGEYGKDWILVDTLKPTNSVNLTEVLLMSFDDMALVNDVANRIWALEDKNLRLIDLNDVVTVSGALLKNVEKIQTDGSNVLYMAKNKKNEAFIGVYKEGEKSGVVVQQIGGEISEVGLAISSYNGKKWLAYSLDERYFVKSGDEFPTTKKAAANLKIAAENDLSFVPTALVASPSGRFALAVSETGVTVFDTEVDRRFEYEASLPQIESMGWLNDYLIWSNLEGDLSVRDFNGDNLRSLVLGAADFPVVMSKNNHWLYFVQELENGTMALMRKRVY